MVIKSVFDKEFAQYGKVIEGYDFSELLKVLREKTDCPKDSVLYYPGVEDLEAVAVSKEIADNIYGGMPIQVGCCNGHNKALNCLEYHRDSEINIVDNDVVLLVASEQKVIDNKISSDEVEAFFAPKGTAVEVYATTLHYAPCTPKDGTGFRVIIVLPKGTNTDKPSITVKNDEDKLLFACNKWLIAHKDASEVQSGAVAGITGKNIILE